MRIGSRDSSKTSSWVIMNNFIINHFVKSTQVVFCLSRTIKNLHYRILFVQNWLAYWAVYVVTVIKCLDGIFSCNIILTVHAQYQCILFSCLLLFTGFVLYQVSRQKKCLPLTEIRVLKIILRHNKTYNKRTPRKPPAASFLPQPLYSFRIKHVLILIKCIKILWCSILK